METVIPDALRRREPRSSALRPRAVAIGSVSTVAMRGLECIGWTPLSPIDGIWVKLECSNPGGSVIPRRGFLFLRGTSCRRLRGLGRTHRGVLVVMRSASAAAARGQDRAFIS